MHRMYLANDVATLGACKQKTGRDHAPSLSITGDMSEAGGGGTNAAAPDVSERTNYPSDMAEMALAHTISDKVEAANRRGDMFEMRRRMMADWAMFCDTVEMKGKTATPTPSDELIGRIPHEMNHPINSL